MDELWSIANLTGSDFDDSLTGDDCANLLDGGAGADTVDGKGGSDTASHVRAAGAVTVDLINRTAGGADGSDELRRELSD